MSATDICSAENIIHSLQFELLFRQIIWIVFIFRKTFFVFHYSPWSINRNEILFVLIHFIVLFEINWFGHLSDYIIDWYAYFDCSDHSLLISMRYSIDLKSYRCTFSWILTNNSFQKRNVWLIYQWSTYLSLDFYFQFRLILRTIFKWTMDY